MYYIEKTLEVSAAHALEMDYDSKCTNLHGHNYMITVSIKGTNLNKDGMLVDFAKVKEVVMKLDHAHLNNFISQPTAECMAKWICDKINSYLDRAYGKGEEPVCYKVEIEETEGSVVIYEL